MTYDDVWWPDIEPDLKNDGSSFVIISDALSNAAYCVSLRGPEAKLEGGGLKQPRPGAFGAEQRLGEV